ncbi:ribosome biogenesis protein C1orf109 homolog [Mercenaria mercenaria]|uniref:ribosome biogenesis protein C1orf109 homolog n=1 Tax=Mercenaria mercenaria TaxID=6596 RepID=UPI00234EA00D|nr:ribosome biogenesis protein C1orf109 homolog [Mercenaria mercenaria]XP_045193376.2 ribosome biogenesis protein C1orf109 homolog [Mercenaria mercenaria]
MQKEGSLDVEDIQRQLQKAFNTLKKCFNGIKEVEEKARPCIKMIINLTEQFHCCTAVTSPGLPLNIDFNEVRQKLLYKISTEINENISKLQTLICRYEEYSDCMGSQYDRSMSKCGRYTAAKDISQLLERSPLYPSVTDMLEWVQISERSIRETYLCKKFIIDTFSPDQPGICDSLESSWQEGDKDLYNQLDEYIALTSNFMEMKIS